MDILNLSNEDEEKLCCFVLIIIVGWIIYKICKYNSNKVEQYINMDQYQKVNQEDAEGDMNEGDNEISVEKINFPKPKTREFPPSLVNEGEILSQMNHQLQDYKLLDESVSVQSQLQQIDNQLAQPSPDAFSSMYAPIQFESQLMRSPDEIHVPVQGKELPESMTGKQGGKTLNIIMVYAPWCGWSKKALPDFDRLIRDYNGKTMNGTLVQVIKYDSEVDTEMVKKYDVEGFPSFIMEKVTTRTTTEDINERTYDGLVSIIKKNV